MISIHTWTEPEIIQHYILLISSKRLGIEKFEIYLNKVVSLYEKPGTQTGEHKQESILRVHCDRSIQVFRLEPYSVRSGNIV